MLVVNSVAVLEFDDAKVRLFFEVFFNVIQKTFALIQNRGREIHLSYKTVENHTKQSGYHTQKHIGNLHFCRLGSANFFFLNRIVLFFSLIDVRIDAKRQTPI